jgi:alkylation response protein AidB-like acyl-CoA dehydrogenase
MNFEVVPLNVEQEAFRQSVRDFVDEVTGEVLEHERTPGSGYNPQVFKALGERGWIMPHWPEEIGGAGLDSICLRVLQMELLRGRVPGPMNATRTVFAAVDRAGDPELAVQLRPKVARGEVQICLGYTEPEGGSDIANAKVKAVLDGDDWVINGSKIFTSASHYCQYVFLLTRTDPTLPKHKGLTMFLVPLSTPGIVVQGIETFGGERTNITYYSDVRISDRYRVGEVNGGWAVVHGPLDEEHSVGLTHNGLMDISIGQVYVRELQRAVDATAAYLSTAIGDDGKPMGADPVIQWRLGEIVMMLEAAASAEGAIGRVSGSEALIDGAAALMDLLGAAAVIPHGQPGAIGDGAVEFANRFAQGTATYGGTVEIFRNMIAHSLGLPQLDLPGRRAFLAATGNKPGA